MAVGTSASAVPEAPRPGDGVDAGGEGGGSELPRRSGDPSRTSVRSREVAAQPAGGAATSKGGAVPSRTATLVLAPRPSQVAPGEQPRAVGGSRRPHGKTPVHYSQDAQDQSPHQRTGGGRMRL